MFDIFSIKENNLVNKIASKLDVKIKKLNVAKFSDGEINVSAIETVREKDCYLIQSTCAPSCENLMKLLIAIDALKRSSARKIIAVIPYFGFARQDRQSHVGEPITAKLVADLIVCAGAKKVITMDLHSPQIQGFFNIPVENLIGMPIFIQHVKKIKNFNYEDYSVIAPDAGSVAKSRIFAQMLNCPLVTIDKHRKSANISEVMNITGDVYNKNLILIDDMIDTAGTVYKSAEVLKSRGCKDIHIYATHAVLSGQALERLSDKLIKKVVFLDTIELPTEKKLEKFEILSAAEIFANSIC
jgi:ribose-phosphate pyrophosphokinase